MYSSVLVSSDPTGSLVTITSSGQPVVGESLSLYCLLQLSENAVINSSTYSWRQLDIVEAQDMMGSGSVSEGFATGEVLEFNSLNATSGGMYECTVTAQLPNGSEIYFSGSTNLTVSCKFKILVSALYNYFPVVSISSVSITTSKSHPLYAGTSFTLTCLITLSQSVNVPVLVDASWTRSGDSIPETNDTRIIETFLPPVGSLLDYESTLELSFLVTADSGEYQCNATVEPLNVASFIQSTHIANATNIIITGREIVASCISKFYTILSF